MAATLLSSHRYLKLWLYNWIEEGIVRDYLVTTHWSQVISQSVFNTIPLYFVVRLVDRKQHGDLTPSSWSAWCLTWEFSQNDLSILGWWIWITILHTMSSPNMLCGEIWPKGERGGRGWGGGGWDGVRDGWWSRRRELSGSTCNNHPLSFRTMSYETQLFLSICWFNFCGVLVCLAILGVASWGCFTILPAWSITSSYPDVPALLGLCGGAPELEFEGGLFKVCFDPQVYKDGHRWVWSFAAQGGRHTRTVPRNRKQQRYRLVPDV